MSVGGTAGGYAPPGVYSSGYDRRRRRPARSRRWRLGILLAIGCGALAGIVYWRGDGPREAEPALPSSFSRMGFVADERLAPMLSLRPGEVARGKVRYEARIRPSNAERWDTLTFGDVEGDDILFQLTLYVAKSAVLRPGLFVDLARQSADLDAAIVHAASAQSSLTERGSIESAEVTLAGPRAERRCLGFRFTGSQEVDLFGLACGARGAPLDPSAFGRLIDRLAATGVGVEAGLGAILKNSAS
jgi:hypothetical protein